jgi:hypothetical protein
MAAYNTVRLTAFRAVFPQAGGCFVNQDATQLFWREADAKRMKLLRGGNYSYLDASQIDAIINPA